MSKRCSSKYVFVCSFQSTCNNNYQTRSKKKSSWSSCCFPTLYSVTRGGGVAALCSDDSEREGRMNTSEKIEKKKDPAPLIRLFRV